MSGTLRVGAGYPPEGILMRGLMSRFFSIGANPPDDDPARPNRLASWPDRSWRDEKIEDPFDDLRIRQRMADLISQSALKPGKSGA